MQTNISWLLFSRHNVRRGKSNGACHNNLFWSGNVIVIRVCKHIEVFADTVIPYASVTRCINFRSSHNSPFSPKQIHKFMSVALH